MVAINNNIGLPAQRQLNKAADKVGRIFERLSSGLRINRASDDAAGLAIAQDLNVNTRLYNKAVRNLNDGISALSIVESALNSQTDIIIRMRELAEQSANGVYSNAQRIGLNKEYQALLKEFGRIGESTSFNNMNLLMAGRGSNSNQLNFQVGIDGTLNSLLSAGLVDSGELSGNVLAGTSMPQLFDFNPHSTLDYLTGAGTFARFTLTDSGGTQRDVGILMQIQNGGTIQFDFYIRGDHTNGAIYGGADRWVNVGTSGTSFNTSTGILNAASVSRNFTFAGGATGSLVVDLRGLRIQSGTATTATSTNNISMTGIENQQQSQNAMSVLKSRQDQIATTLGQIGAVQSRLSSAAQVVASQAENSSAAKSRIEDADIAVEAATLIAEQIKQQAAAAVLGMINKRGELVLSLLD